MKRRYLGLLVLGLWLLACGTPASAPPTGSQQAPGSGTRSSGPKILVASIVEDPKNFWDGTNGGGGSGARELGHLVNQYLAAVMPDGTPQPRLLARLPSVANGDWVVNDDGTMQVTYNLRPDVTWHDGVPFTADDMVFSWQVGRDPAIPNGNQGAMRLVSNFEALDPQTAVATWRETYPFADRLEHREFFPLPAHILQSTYQENKANLLGHPYFTDEYVGTGPFKVSHWEHGSQLDLVANDNYFLGRPKLDGIRVMFIADQNTMLANLSAGSVNLFLPPGGPNWAAYQPLRQKWAGDGGGQVLIESVRWTFIEIQKSAAAQPADINDARARQALLMSIDRKELAESLLGELGVVADSWVSPQLPYYQQVRGNITQYPYDARQATALLGQLGWTMGGDGVLQKNGAPFQFVLTYTNQDAQAAASTVQQNWKAIGVSSQIQPLTAFQLRDAEARASFTGGDMTNNPMGGGLAAVRRFESAQIPTSTNRYAGTNRGSFNDPQWDTIGAQIRTSLDESERIALEGQLLAIFSAQLPALPMNFEIQAVPAGGFTGIKPVTGTAHTGNIMHTTNAHEWVLTQ
jgi:peptide/nickel transport system substrate-binding protein